MRRNRWLIALAAVGIHICIGSVYAWSVLTKPVMAAMGLTLSETTWAFSLAILFLGMSAGFLGGFVERIGPSRSGLVSALFFGTGLLGTALAVHMHSSALLYLFYGCIGGIGLGTGYITPVSTLVKWFPRHRGFATGLAIMGFGFAALIAGPVMRWLVDTYGLLENFIILGCVYAVVMIASASYLRPPKKGEIPALILAVASPMAQEVIGMTPAQAASLVGIIGIVNGGGRIVWSSISDWIGRGVTYMVFFLFEVFAFHQLSITREGFIFQALVLAIISCYGGGFSCMPAFLSDIFGVRQLASIHGSILTAWGIAGVAGPLILAFMKETTGSYSATLQLFAGMLAVAFVISAVLHWRNEVDKKRYVMEEASKDSISNMAEAH